MKTFWGWNEKQLPDGTVIFTLPAWPDVRDHTRAARCCFQACERPNRRARYARATSGRPARADRTAMMPRRPAHPRAEPRTAHRSGTSAEPTMPRSQTRSARCVLRRTHDTRQRGRRTAAVLMWTDWSPRPGLAGFLTYERNASDSGMLGAMTEPQFSGSESGNPYPPPPQQPGYPPPWPISASPRASTPPPPPRGRTRRHTWIRRRRSAVIR